MLIIESIPYKDFKERIRIVQSLRKQFKKIKRIEDKETYVYFEAYQTNKGSLLGL